MALPAYENLSIYKGDDFKYVINVSVNKIPVDWTGSSFYSQLRLSSDNLLFGTFNVTGDNLGNLTLVLPRAQTATMLVGGKTYKYDVEITSPGGLVRTWITGSVSVIQDVTVPS